MIRTKRTKAETIQYFKQLVFEYEKQADRNDDLVARGIAEAYELAAFQVERNME